MPATIAVMQPTYLPWLGYFDLIRQADLFVIYNTVKFDRQSWQQRNRIRSRSGELMLTVPVKSKGEFGQPISGVQLHMPARALAKHLSAIEQSYSKAPCFAKWHPGLKQIYSQEHTHLQDLNLALIRLGMKALGLTTPLVLASDLQVQGTRVEALIDICKKLQAGRYLSPEGARGYIEENNLFPENGIELCFQQYRHPIYRQLNYPDFISHLSFLDYIFNTSDTDF